MTKKRAKKEKKNVRLRRKKQSKLKSRVADLSDDLKECINHVEQNLQHLPTNYNEQNPHLSSFSSSVGWRLKTKEWGVETVTKWEVTSKKAKQKGILLSLRAQRSSNGVCWLGLFVSLGVKDWWNFVSGHCMAFGAFSYGKCWGFVVWVCVFGKVWWVVKWCTRKAWITGGIRKVHFITQMASNCMRILNKGKWKLPSFGCLMPL